MTFTTEFSLYEQSNFTPIEEIFQYHADIKKWMK